MSTEKSVFIIKPEAMKFRTEITGVIESSGLRIERSRTALLHESDLVTLYDNLSPVLMKATIHFMLNGECEIGEVAGKDAVSRLLRLAGTSTNPTDCAPMSIRYKFGQRTPALVGQTRYFRNAIHRSKNSKEAKRDLALLDAILARHT